MCDGPRTSQICILLKYRLLQKSIVRGPHFFEDHEQGCFALHCVSVDYKKLMFAVRCPDERLCARDIQMLQILHSASGCVYGDKIDCV